MKRRIMINGIIMAFALLLVVIFPKVFFRSRSQDLTEKILGGLGFIAIILGQLIRVSARGYKAEHSKNSHALIEGGPYQIVRNPMYLGILFIGLGVVLMLFNWWVVFFFLFIYGLRYLPLILAEERKLKQMFPGAYPAYCSRVPRMIPKPCTLVKIKIAQYLPLRSAWFKKEINSIVLLLIVTLWFFLGKR